MFSPYYNRVIRKMVVAFGTLFNNITLVRYNKENTQEFERIRVPLIYSPKEKFITRLFSDPDLTRSLNTIVPRMGFEITGYSYDAARKPITVLQNFGASNTPYSRKIQNVGVPYNIDFSLSIYVRNIEDGTQIVEQILPYFTPDYTVTVNFVDGIAETTKDIPFILNSVDNTIEYEGDFRTTRLIIWNLNFTAKTFFFGPVSEGKIIMGQTDGNGNPLYDANGKQIGGVNVNAYQEFFNRELQELNMTSPSFGNFKENETVRVKNSRVYSTVYNWNSSTQKLMLSNTNGYIKIGDVLVGDSSGASWEVESYNGSYVKIFNVNVVQDPITAGPDDDYGFTTEITEFPNAE